MAVIYDSSAAGTKVSGVVSLTYSFTNSSTDALVVGVGGNWVYDSRVSGIKYNNISLALIMSTSDAAKSNLGYAAGYLMSPPAGTYNIEITMLSSTNVTWLNAIAMSVTGATGTPAFKVTAISSTATTRSETISSQSGGVIASIALLAGNSNGGWTVDAQSTERAAATYATPWVLKGATKSATYPSTTVTWTNNEGAGTRNSVLMTFAFNPRETVLNPSYYYDFQTDTNGYMPNGWTMYNDWVGYGESTGTVATVDGTDKAFTIPYNGGNALRYAYNNTIGKVDLSQTPVEIAAKFKLQKGTVQDFPADSPCLAIGIQEDAGLYNACAVSFSFKYSYADKFFFPIYTNGGLDGNAGETNPQPFIPQTNTWYYVRFRRETNGVHKGKVWLTTDVEPDWQVVTDINNSGFMASATRFTSGRIGLSSYVYGSTYTWAQVGISLDGGAASLDGTFPPSITSVDTDNILTASQTNIAIAGFHLVGVTSAAIIQGSTSIPQTVTINSETSATFNLAFDTNTYDVKYGTALLRLTSSTGVANKTISVIPTDARCYRDLTSINATAENRITALPDLAIGDQIEVTSVNGGAISDVNINSDGTFDAPAAVTSFTCRAWSASDGTWGSPGLQAMVASAIRRRVIVIL